MYIVFVLQSLKSGHLYVGFTKGLDRRVRQHNLNQNQSTKNRGPWRVVFTEVAQDRPAARRREKYLKSGIGKERLKKILQIGHVAEWQTLQT